MKDYQRIARSLIKSIRGKTPQEALNRALGYTFNQVYKWESGDAKIKWPDFVRLCAACEVDLRKPVKIATNFHGDIANSAAITKIAALDMSVAEIAKTCEVHPTRVRRWLQGSQPIILECFLKLIDLNTSTLNTFIGNLIPGTSESTHTNEPDRVNRLELEYLYKNPDAVALKYCLDLKIYKDLKQHSDELVAKWTGISLSKVKRHLKELKKRNVLVFHDNKYTSLHQGRLDFRLNDEGFNKLYIHSLQRHIALLKSARPLRKQSLTGMHVFAANSELFAKLSDKTLKYYSDIMKTIESDKGPHDFVGLFTLGTLDFGN